nr:MAG TPA: hypothetical protein [Caudoviricetes sp.]
MYILDKLSLPFLVFCYVLLYTGTKYQKGECLL